MTPAHLILTAIYYSLSRFANSEQVCITTVSSGRSNLHIRNTVGMFVNTLALSATIGKQTVKEFLQEVSENFDETLRHENYPFAQIAADYGLTAEIQYVYQLGLNSQYVCQGAPLEIENMELQIPKFPITFFIAPVAGQPSVCVEYDNGKYSSRLMQSLADAVRVTVERMMAKPDAALTSISIVSDEEAKRIIKMGTGKEIDVDLSKTFANLFTEQARRTPDAPAVVDKDSNYIGGAIMPGLRLGLSSLVSETSMLSGISLDLPKHAIGHNTVDAMRSGLVYGHAAMIDGLLDRMEEEMGRELTAIATGGLASSVVPVCRHEIILDKTLLLTGMQVIYEKNTYTGSP